MSAEMTPMCDDDRAASEALTSTLKSKALELGANLVGVGPVERWAQAPDQMRPDGHWPDCRNVVVVAIHHPNACVELGGIPTAYDMGPYGVQSDMNERLEYIQFHLGRWLERQGHQALTIAATNIWRFRPYKDVVRPFGPDLSDIHAAAACGLGEMGYHGLLMTPEYGTWQRFCCLMTDAPLIPDPMYDGPPLCDHCGICVTKCDEMCGGALAHEVKGEIVLNVGGKELRYADKNMWRCAWSEHFGLTIGGVEIPEVVTEEVILEYLAKYGRRGGVQGPCLKYCRPPHLRNNSGLKEVPEDAPPNRAITDRIRKMAVEARMASFAVVSAAQLHEAGIETEPHLPDCRSAIIIGMNWPADSNPTACGPAGEPCLATSLAVRQTLAHMHLDIAEELERFGYYTVVRTKLPLDEAAAVAGISAENFGGRLQISAILTQAPLQPTSTSLVCRHESAPPDTMQMRQIIGEDGADLIGVAPASALDEIAEQLKAVVNEDELKINVVLSGPIHGQPEVAIRPRENAHVVGPSDWIEGAKSVIVLGMVYPDENLTRAGEPPADAAGPYAFSQYQIVRDLGVNALMIGRELEHRGFRAAITYDVCGTGSMTENPRFDIPDIFSNRFAAVAAGLGVIGRGGFVITPDNDVCVRYVAIVTDAEITPTSGLPADFDPCADCDAPCLAACPVDALSGEETECAGESCWAKRDFLRCDWAKKYALVGDAGPKFMGSHTDVPVPDGEITAELIAEAMLKRDPIQRHLDCIIEGCLKACHGVRRGMGTG